MAGYFDRRRRARHAQSQNWPLLVDIKIMGTELDRAKEAGVPEDAQSDCAIEIRDAVYERIGGQGPLIQAFIDCDYEMKTSDKDAVLARALEVSGYERVRAELPLLLVAAIRGGDEEGEGATGSNDSQESEVVTASPSESRTTTSERSRGPQDVVITSGFTQAAPNSIGDSYVSYAVVVENPNNDRVARHVSLHVALYDASNTVVAAETRYARLVLPSQKWAVGTFTAAAGITRMEVQARVQSWEDVTDQVGTFTVSGLNVVAQQYTGHPQVTGTIASTFAGDLQQVQVVAVFYNADNAIIGGAFTFAAFIPAGGTGAFGVSSLIDVPGIDHADVIPSVSNLILVPE